MDKRKKFICVLDTETANGILEDDGSLNLMYSLIYDIGYAIIDKQGNVYEKKSFMVADLFVYEKELLTSAYYKEKIPQYKADWKAGKRTMYSLLHIQRTLVEDLAKYNCTTLCCHNASFDIRALNNTIRYITKSKIRYFLPNNIEVWDSLQMARDIFPNMPTYVSFCITNGYMTHHLTPRVQLTAEVIHRYLTDNIAFVESHTGLEDVLIECGIVTYCLRRHKKMRKVLYEARAIA